MAGVSNSRRLGAFVACVVLGATASCKAPPLAAGTVPPATISNAFDWDAYALGAGDVVSVLVFRHPEFSTPERGELVDFQGKVSLPLVGFVSVGGMTTEAARAAITERLREYVVDPAVSVSVVQYGARRVYVFGEVEEPGAYALDRPINALQALSFSGGFRNGADREKVALLRAAGSELEVHFFDAATPGVDGLVAVQPGDFLFVRQSGAGTFSEQILPYAQGLTPILGSIASLIVIAEALGDD